MLGLIALLAVPAAAHITCWHPSMYGFAPEDKQANAQANPLQLDSHQDQWWFHGYKDQPPPEGVFMEIPSGGIFTCQLGQQKGYTDWGCDGCQQNATDTPVYGNKHAPDTADGQPNLDNVMGTALSIVYSSDPNGFGPNDMVVISTNRSSPWWKYTGYEIPANLPPCPPGGCHCSWNWQHDHAGGGQEMYHNMYRCQVTNANPNSPPLAKPVVPRKCPFDKNNCTMGAKTPMWWTVNEGFGGNIFQDAIDPPVYNLQYGFEDGAQNDIWYHDEGNHWDPNAPNAPGPREQTATYKTLGLTAAAAPTGPGGANGNAQAVKPTPTPQPNAESPSPSSSGSSAQVDPAVTSGGGQALHVEGGGEGDISFESSAAGTDASAPGKETPPAVGNTPAANTPAANTPAANAPAANTPAANTPAANTPAGSPSSNSDATDTSAAAPTNTTGKKKCKRSRSGKHPRRLPIHRNRV